MNSGEQFLLSNLQFFLRARLIPPVSFSCLLHTEDFCLVSFFSFRLPPFSSSLGFSKTDLAPGHNPPFLTALEGDHPGPPYF